MRDSSQLRDCLERHVENLVRRDRAHPQGNAVTRNAKGFREDPDDRVVRLPLLRDGPHRDHELAARTPRIASCLAPGFARTFRDTIFPFVVKNSPSLILK